MTQDGLASAAGPLELDSEWCQGKSGRRCRSRRTCPQCHSSHPSNLNQRQNCQNVHGIQGSFRSDTKTQAKNIGVALKEQQQAGDLLQLASDAAELLAHTFQSATICRDQRQQCELSWTFCRWSPPHSNTQNESGSMQQSQSPGLQSPNQVLRGLKSPDGPSWFHAAHLQDTAAVE